METAIIEEWLRARLQAYIAGYAIEPAPYEVNPQEVAVVYRHMSGTDLRNYGTVKLGEESVYQVAAVGCLPDTPNIGPLKPLMVAIDAALDTAVGQTDDGVVWSCTKQSPICFPYTGDNGHTVIVAGGLYSIRAGVASE